jgi:hypothetical protein
VTDLVPGFHVLVNIHRSQAVPVIRILKWLEANRENTGFIQKKKSNIPTSLGIDPIVVCFPQATVVVYDDGPIVGPIL